MGIKVVVTGGYGFMGSDFVRFLLDHNPGVNITVVDNLAYSSDLARLEGYKSHFSFKQADIRDTDEMIQLTDEADFVFNFAAETHNDNSLERPLDFISTNVDGVVSLLEAARVNNFHFHQVSTDEVFGDMEAGSPSRFTEDSPIVPSSPYSASKAAGDAICLGWHRSFGVKLTISNSANNFGPYQHPEKLIPRSIELVRQGLKPKIYGDGSNVRDWLNVRDHSRAVWEIATKARKGSRYLISAHHLVSNLELIKFLNVALGQTPDFIEFVTDRPGHDRQYASDSGKLRTELGWKPEGPDIGTWFQTLGV